MLQHFKRFERRRRLTYLIAVRAQQKTRETTIYLIVLNQQNIFPRHKLFQAKLPIKMNQNPKFEARNPKQTSNPINLKSGKFSKPESDLDLFRTFVFSII